MIIQCSCCDSNIDTNEEGYYTTHNGAVICEECRQEEYVFCDYCNELYHVEDTEQCDYGIICNNCIERNTNDVARLREYSFKPKIDVHYATNEDKNNKLFFGFELETEMARSPYSRDEFCKKMHEEINVKLCNGRVLIYFKSDSSLRSGVEIVSHPFTIDYFYENINIFKRIVEYAKELNYKSHDTNGRCGLHVHINRDYFGNDSNSCVNNIVLFTETFKDELKILSRRSNYEYCNFLSDYSSNRKIGNYNLAMGLKFIDEKKSNNRYNVVNNKNDKTIEIRVFRGTLDFVGFASSLEFCFNLARVVKNNDLKGITWSKVINYEGQKFLRKYAISREIKNTYKHLTDWQKYIDREKIVIDKEITKIILSLIKDLDKLQTLYDKEEKQKRNEIIQRLKSKDISASVVSDLDDLRYSMSYLKTIADAKKHYNESDKNTYDKRSFLYEFNYQLNNLQKFATFKAYKDKNGAKIQNALLKTSEIC